jgi:hypothetical protein
MPGNIPITPEQYRRLERLFMRLKHEQIESSQGVVDSALAPLQALGSGGTQWSPQTIPDLQGDVTGNISATVVLKLRGRSLTPDPPSTGDLLAWNGSVWAYINVGALGLDLDDLGDVTIVTPTNGQVLTYDSASSQWKNLNLPTMVAALNDLTDVIITSPLAGQVLTYNGSSWVNDTPVATGQYRQYTWAVDGALGWGFVQVDDGTGQMVPVTALFDLE